MYHKMNFKVCIAFLCVCVSICQSNFQAGPDPWHFESTKAPAKQDETDLPPDLKIPFKKEKQTENKFAFGEWWFKRLLAIMLKSGQVKESEDGSVDVSVQMRFDEDKWKVLDECLKSDTLSDVMLRRAVGYVEDAIYKPTIADQIVMAWTDYIQVYLMEYRTYITWTCGALAAGGILIWLWNHVSHRHIIVIIFILLYLYEVIISYKEAEQQEYDRFLSAVNTCRWYFWTSECPLPSPDPMLFMKHMNPLKIAIRMFTTLVSEPILAINSTVKVMLLEITDGLWFPFDKIVYGLLIVVINISLIYLLIMIVFNFIFNIPFNLNFLGIVSIGVRQSRRSFLPAEPPRQQQQAGDMDRISGDRLDRILNVCSLALNNVHNRVQPSPIMQSSNSTSLPKLQRSSSTGRLPALCSLYNNNDNFNVNDNLKRRNVKRSSPNPLQCSNVSASGDK